MFADFSRPIKPWRFEEIDDIRATVPEGFLFVRKVNPAVPALADLIRTGVLRP